MGAFERRLLASVVDVSVIMQLKFQESFVDFYKVLQLQFIDRVVVISVASQSQGSQYKLCKTRDSTVQFFAKVLTCPCCACRDNCGLPAVAGIDMVVDVPVVAVRARGFLGLLSRAANCGASAVAASSTSLVHVPVVMQRQVPMVQTVQLDGPEVWAAHYFDDELWVFFLGPAHRCRAGGRVHRDTALP